MALRAFPLDSVRLAPAHAVAAPIVNIRHCPGPNPVDPERWHELTPLPCSARMGIATARYGERTASTSDSSTRSCWIASGVNRRTCMVRIASA